MGVLFFLGCGCACVRHAVPEELMPMAGVSGMRDIRAFSGIPSDSFKKDFVQLLEDEQGKINAFDFNVTRVYSVLAVSGGGANGAYGAGILNGWTRSGTRPVFKVVTGISTGAIIAPLAFLGSDYDGRLKEFYTKYSTRDIARMRLPFGHNSFATTRPLRMLIERYFDESLFKAVAAEYSKGRRLYVGTTNLDAQRLVIWDMGKIASIGDENALELFRKIILASASIPVAFPPVYLEVEAGDRKYDEMHVDGGICKQVFFLYDVLQGFNAALKEKNIDPARNRYSIYVIRNGYVNGYYREIPDKLMPIIERTVDSITSAQGVGDLYQLYLFAVKSKGDFNLAYIPDGHKSGSKELFDPAEMRALFDLGCAEAENGYTWKKTPPGMY